jgi:catechol 2,3-dioxygenase-like lactoylglutathione lyase family enzyme
MILTEAMPTIFVSNLDVAVRFYTETLGLKLIARHGEHFASVSCGQNCTLGLHPASSRNPSGTMAIGFRCSEPIQESVKQLKARGARVLGDITDDTQVLLATFQDPDGSQLYLAEVRPHYRG